MKIMTNEEAVKVIFDELKTNFEAIVASDDVEVRKKIGYDIVTELDVIAAVLLNQAKK